MRTRGGLEHVHRQRASRVRDEVAPRRRRVHERDAVERAFAGLILFVHHLVESGCTDAEILLNLRILAMILLH